MIWAAVALLLGLVVVIVLALLGSSSAEQPDPSTVWEARAAVGFTAVVVAGPFWLGQGIATLVATFVDSGTWPGWLWVWFGAAPLVGGSPPAAALVRAVRRALPDRPARQRWHAAAVQQEANFAWAATHAEPEWELRRTPPLPESWPPEVGGRAVWFCYAERACTPQIIEVSAPWARIVLAPGEAARPIVERLSDAVELLGVQAVVPLESVKGSTGPVLDDLWLGDPDGRLARTLRDWRGHHGRIAGHPVVAPHLPPRTGC